MKYWTFAKKHYQEINAKAEQVIIESGGNLADAIRILDREMRGAVNTGNATQVLILIFVAIVVIYQLIPQISGANSTVQNSTNVTSMGKFAAGLGEWLFPLLGIIAIVFLLFKRSGKGSTT